MKKHLEFLIMSKSKAKRMMRKTLTKDYAVISINNTQEEPVRLAPNEKIKAVLSLSFDDIDDDKDGAMTDEDANKIVEFLKVNKEKVDVILVHCEAGISRSARVCAAIMKALTGSDSPIFDNLNYHPNMYCYFKVINAFEKNSKISSNGIVSLNLKSQSTDI